MVSIVIVHWTSMKIMQRGYSDCSRRSPVGNLYNASYATELMWLSSVSDNVYIRNVSLEYRLVTMILWNRKGHCWRLNFQQYTIL